MANRYWIQGGTGGNGNWSDTAHWSETSGGSGNASVPTEITDTAIFDVNSFSVSGKNVIIQGIIVDCHISTTDALPFEIMIDTYELTPGASSLTLHEDLHLYYLQVNDTFDFNGYNVYAEGVAIQDTGIVSIGSQFIEIETTGVYNSPEFSVSSGASVDFTASNIIFHCFNGADNSFQGGGFTYGTVDINVDGQFSWYESMSFDTLSFVGDGEVILGDYEINITLTVTSELQMTGTTSGGLIVRAYTESDPVYTGNIMFSSSGMIDVDNCTLINTTATGGATFNALTADGNVDGGGNTGWNFSSSMHIQEEITESLLINDSQDTEWTLTGGHYFDQTISEDLGMEDIQDSTGTFNNSLTESVDLADSYIIGWPESLADGVTIIDSHAIGWAKTIEDILFLYEELKSGWGLSITEDLTLTDSLSYVLGLLISDWLTLIDSQTNNWNGKEVHTDTLMIYDLCQGGKVFYDTLNESLVATDTNLLKLTVSILEYLGFTELVSAIKTCANSINDGLVLTDSADRGFTFAITEALSAVDTLSVVTTFLGAISESLVLADTVSFIKKIYPSISESLVFAETVSNKGTFYDAVYDTLAMNVTIELADDVYECYVLNTPRFMPSMYSGFGFNSYCVFENRSFGADDTGIYELTGSTDNGSQIHTGVILSETDFGSPNKKRFRRGYLGTSGDSPVMVFEAEDGSRQAYNIDTQGKVVASSELKSKKWKLSVADFDELSTIKLIPVILTK